MARQRKFLVCFLAAGLCLFAIGSCGKGIRVLSVPKEITAWSFVDGNGVNGINKNSAQGAGIPQLVSLNSKLYATWQELSSVNQVRVAVFNGDDVNSTWTFVDGNSTTGLNKNSAQNILGPQPIVFNSKLYICWYEPNAGVAQIRVIVYNGNDSAPSWSFVDGGGANGLNYNSGQPGNVPMLAVFNSKLYATWHETGGGILQIRVAVYNGNDSSPQWSFVDGNTSIGINKSASQHGAHPYLAVFNSKLYATWQEFNGAVNQVRVAAYNGNDAAPTWTFVDGNGVNGLNKDVTRAASSPQLLLLNSKFYVLWTEANAAANQVRVAVYSGSDSAPSWAFIDGGGTNGLNKDPTQPAATPSLASFNLKLYTTWSEPFGGTNQIRTAVYNNNDSAPAWTFIDGNGSTGINKDVTKGATTPELALFNSKLYSAWQESNGSASQIRVARASCNGSTDLCNPLTSW